MSGRKPFLPPFKSLDAGDLSQSSLESAVTNIQGYDNVAVQINCVTTDAVGTFEVQGSLDQVNFVPIDLASTPSVSGADKQILLDLADLSFSYIKTTYTGTGTDGVVDVWVSAKGK